jgi:TATA-binding protein-associated factor
LKGGAVAPKSAKQSKALEVENGLWIWDGVAKVLEVDLFSPAWEIRHGAAMALRELLKLQGKCGGMRGKYILSESGFPWLTVFCQTTFHLKQMLLRMKSGVTTSLLSCCAYSFWTVSVTSCLIKFVFVTSYASEFSDIQQVVAPVRETVSQTLASLLLHMPRRCLLHVHFVLLQMIRQDFTTNIPRKSQKETDKGLIWEIRHAGLLGIKYEVAVRSDLFESVKDESYSEMGGREVLEGVVEAAILG